MELLDRLNRLSEVFEDVMEANEREAVVLEGPRKLVQVVDHVNPRECHEVVIDPTGKNLVTTAEMQAFVGHVARS
jgi:hypothetical protein